jgi:hypothetical protein
MKFILLALSIFIFGCASIENNLQSYVGKHYSDVIARWGPATSIHTDGRGGKIMIWEFTSTYTVPGTVNTNANANTYGSSYGYNYGANTNVNANTSYTPAQTKTYTKRRTFYVNSNGIIYNWAWQGL